MKTYSVIGFWDDTDQAFCDHVQASDQYEAMGKVGTREGVGTLVLIGAIEGEHDLLTAGDDNDSTCYASEMAEFATIEKEV